MHYALKYLQIRLLFLYLFVILGAYAFSQFVGIYSATQYVLERWYSTEHADEEMNALLTSIDYALAPQSAAAPSEAEAALLAWFDSYTANYFELSYEHTNDANTYFFLLKGTHEVMAQRFAGSVAPSSAANSVSDLQLSPAEHDLLFSMPLHATNEYKASAFAGDGSLLFVIGINLPTLDDSYTILAHIATPYSFVDSFIYILDDTLPTWLFGGIFLLVSGFVYTFLITRSLNTRFGKLARAAKAWAQGQFEIRVQDTSQDEVGQLTVQFNRMADQLDTLMQERQAFSIVEERNRVARDLHDSIKQQIFAVSMQISTAYVFVKPDHPAYASLEQAKQTIQLVQKELTAFIRELRPVGLQNQGLVDALHQLSAIHTKQSGIRFSMVAQAELKLPFQIEVALFRIAQEACSNVLKHSHATDVTCSLQIENQWVVLSIKDNGQGLTFHEQSNQGFGLISMRERIEALRGRLDLKSSPGHGMELIVSCPLFSDELGWGQP